MARCHVRCTLEMSGTKATQLYYIHFHGLDMASAEVASLQDPNGFQQMSGDKARCIVEVVRLWA